MGHHEEPGEPSETISISSFPFPSSLSLHTLRSLLLYAHGLKASAPAPEPTDHDSSRSRCRNMDVSFIGLPKNLSQDRIGRIGLPCIKMVSGVWAGVQIKLNGTADEFFQKCPQQYFLSPICFRILSLLTLRNGVSVSS